MVFIRRVPDGTFLLLWLSTILPAIGIHRNVNTKRPGFRRL